MNQYSSNYISLDELSQIDRDILLLLQLEGEPSTAHLLAKDLGTEEYLVNTSLWYLYRIGYISMFGLGYWGLPGQNLDLIKEKFRRGLDILPSV